jgi:cation diffusion facilitator CzcD-associated flavoprotein CzcO
VAVHANPDTARPTDEIVDVLIIGAGASGAAVAWSLAETRMKILCLDQTDRIPEQRSRLGGASLR